MLKTRILPLAMILAALNVFGQQDPLNTQFIQNPVVVNPAYAGSRDAMNVTLAGRIQWTGFEGAPRTQFLNLHSPIQDKSLGAGFAFVNDKLGPVKQTGFYGDFAYRLPVSETGALRVGLRVGANVFSANLTELETNDSNDPIFNTNVSGELLPGVGFGVYYSDDKFFGGLSVPNFLQNEVSADGDVETVRAYKQGQHLFALAGAILELNPDVLLKPGLAARLTTGAPASVDINVNALFYEKIWFGVMHRLNDSFGGILQFQLSDQLLVGYSYDMTTSGLKDYNSGTHEFLISYDFVFSKGRVNSPRYF